MKTIIVVLSSILIITPFSFAQGWDTLWTKTYGGTEDDYGYSVQQTLDSGYVIVGETRSFGADGSDVWLLKTDENGDTLWTMTYGGDSVDIGYSVQQTSDSGFIIAGETSSFGAGSSDVYLIKTDSLGNTLWTRTYGGTMSDKGHSVQQTSDTGYIIVGCTRSFAVTTRDYWLIKANALGDTLWTRIYSLDDFDYGLCVKENSDRGYIIAGTSGGRASGSCAILMRTDSLGSSLWNEGYVAYANKVSGGCFNSVQLTPDGGYIAAGGPYVFLVKTDSLGDSLWVKRYGEAEFWGDWGYSVQPISDVGYLVAGDTKYFGAGGSDIWLLITDDNGDTLWTKTYGGAYDDGARAVQQAADEGYVIVGYTGSYGAGGSDVWLLKMVYEPGIEEQEGEYVNSGTFGATVTSGPLLLPEGKRCRVFDITGRVVEPTRITRGIYFIEIDDIIVRKVIKIR